MPRERQCKLVVIGDGSVGKTSVIKAFVDDGFQRAYKQVVSSRVCKRVLTALQQTIGCDFFEKSIILQQQTRVSLSVWDVGGQSAASNNIANYLEGAHVGFFCYDVTNAESFLNIVRAVRALTAH
jgi:GTPase SAR1 family protein